MSVTKTGMTQQETSPHAMVDERQVNSAVCSATALESKTRSISPEQRAKLSAALKAKWASGTRKPTPKSAYLKAAPKISAALTGIVRGPLTADRKAHLSKVLSGRVLRKTPHSEAEKERLRQTQAKYAKINATPERAARIAQSLKSSKVAADAREKSNWHELAEAARAISPLTGRFETNNRAIVWFLRSPSNVTYQFRNLAHFIRNHSELFTEYELGVVNRFGRTRAQGGLSQLSPHNKHAKGSWHGWTWNSVAE
jgi:hypothetical protein